MKHDALPDLPESLRVNPELGKWLRILPFGGIEISTGKVELGQGILTALAQIAADELDVSFERIRVAATDTAGTPNEGVTAGSHSIEHSGMALRFACAETRAIFLAAAADRLGVKDSDLSVEDGAFIGPGNASTSYWELAESVSLARNATGSAKPKHASRRLTGRDASRLDIPDKVFGNPCFIHDLVLPEMRHGRMIRSTAPHARLERVNEAALRSLPGFVRLVRDGSFLGVLAESEAAAIAAAALLQEKVVWSESDGLPDCERLNDWIRSAPHETSVVDARQDGALAPPSRRIRHRYSRPYLAHASIAPSCALAQWSDGRLKVWSHSQGIFNLRSELALMFSLPPEHIVVEHVQSAGCYGHNGADDAALDAALLARAAEGRPVRLQWSRESELGRAPFGAAMVVEIEAEIDATGGIGHWRHEIWSNGHVMRPGRSSGLVLLAATELAEPFERAVSINPPIAGGGGAERNAMPLYAFPRREIVNHRLLEMPLRTSSMRSLGSYANVFAIESFLDELAAELGEDPLALRLRYLADGRGRAVLQAAARLGDWGARPAAEGAGRGLAFARYKNSGAYCAVVADVDCRAEVRVTRLAIAVDVGETITPDGVINQIEGGAVQATSWTIKEAVTFDRSRVTSAGWETYPILRFSEAPAVSVEIVQRPDDPPLGAGEAAQGPTAAAIANAVYDALGIRVRELPITRERIIAAAETVG
jgi:CO/xanthine dehydrogenase Mo-binding subunit